MEVQACSNSVRCSAYCPPSQHIYTVYSCRAAAPAYPQRGKWACAPLLQLERPPIIARTSSSAQNPPLRAWTCWVGQHQSGKAAPRTSGPTSFCIFRRRHKVRCLSTIFCSVPKWIGVANGSPMQIQDTIFSNYSASTWMKVANGSPIQIQDTRFWISSVSKWIHVANGSPLQIQDRILTFFHVETNWCSERKCLIHIQDAIFWNYLVSKGINVANRSHIRIQDTMFWNCSVSKWVDVANGSPTQIQGAIFCNYQVSNLIHVANGSFVQIQDTILKSLGVEMK